MQITDYAVDRAAREDLIEALENVMSAAREAEDPFVDPAASLSYLEAFIAMLKDET